MGTRQGIAIALLVAACAPQIDGPVERQRIADRDDADRLGAQLAALPGTLSAHVTLRRSVVDPLGARPVTHASAGVLLVVDDRADQAALRETASTLVRAAAPEVTAPAILLHVGAIRPTLAKVGPFSVEASSKPALRATLAIVLALIAALAAWIAVRERRA